MAVEIQQELESSNATRNMDTQPPLTHHFIISLGNGGQVDGV